MDYKNFEESLRLKSYKSIFLKRRGDECFLIIDIDGTPHVLPKMDGKPRIYRHIWQLKDWLRLKFNIDVDSLEVKIDKNN